MSLPQSAVKSAATRRVQVARAVALIAAALFCLFRGLAYAGHIGPETLIGPVAFISGGGRFIWVWNAAWFTAAVLCVVDLVRGSTRLGLSMTVGLTFTWGASYLIAWAIFDPFSRQWLTGITMATLAIVIFGLVMKVSALRDVIESLDREKR